MPCICGQKVDRGQPNKKIQCAKCSEILHLSCENLLPADIEYLQKTNKQYCCKQCTKARRNSILLSPCSVSPPRDAVLATDNSNPNILVPANVLSLPTTSECNKQQINLQTVLDELKSLKDAQEKMIAVISSLQSDKRCLIKKVEDLQLEVKAVRHKLCDLDVAATIPALASDIKDLRNNFHVLQGNVSAVAKNKKGVFGSNPTLPSFSSAPSTSYAAAAAAAAADFAVDNTPAVTIDRNAIACKKLPLAAPPNTKIPNTVGAHSPALPPSLPSQSNQSVQSDNLSLADSQPQSVNEEMFITVGAKTKRTKRKTNNTVVGCNENRELDVIVAMKWIHLSYFNHTVTAESIIEYVHNHAAIDKSDLSCYMLVKKDVELKGLKRVSFKLGVSEKHYKKIFDASLWQENIRVRSFKNFQKEEAKPPHS